MDEKVSLGRNLVMLIGNDKLKHQPVGWHEIDNPHGRALFDVTGELVGSRGDVNFGLYHKMEERLTVGDCILATMGIIDYWEKAGYSHISPWVGCNTVSDWLVVLVAQTVNYRKYVREQHLAGFIRELPMSREQKMQFGSILINE